MTSEKSAPKQIPAVYSRIGYAVFIVSAIVIAIMGDWVLAASMLGIALIFDPFPGTAWTERKIWQKAWLLIHVIVTLVVLGISFFR